MKLHPHIVLLAGLAALQPACTTAARQQEYAEAAGRMEESAAQFRQAVAQSAGAKLRMLSSTSEAEQELPVPAEEYALLREILQHTVAAPPALESDDTGRKDYAWVAELIFADAHGVELTGIVVNYDRWMPNSRARKLRPERIRPWDTPDWSLPDADYAALCSLPTLRRVRALCER